MKKIVALLLAMTLILVLGACAKEPTAEEMYILVNEKTASADKISADMAVDASMVLTIMGQEQTLDMQMEMNLRGEALNTESMRLAMPMSMSMYGVTVDSTAYYADGYYMVDAAGQQVKCPMEPEAALDQFKTGNVQPLDFVTDLAMTYDKQAKLYTMTFGIDIEQAADIAEEYASIIGDIGMANQTINWDTCTGILVADKNGNAVSQTMILGFGISSGDIGMHCDVSVDCIYHPVDEKFTVEVPDADDYLEVSAKMLGLA